MPSGSERQLERDLYDPRVECGCDGAEGGQTECRDDAGAARLETGRRDPSAEAIGDVERLASRFQIPLFVNVEDARQAHIQPKITRSGNAVAAQRAERAVSRVSERRFADPARRAWIGAQGIR